MNQSSPFIMAQSHQLPSVSTQVTWAPQRLSHIAKTQLARLLNPASNADWRMLAAHLRFDDLEIQVRARFFSWRDWGLHRWQRLILSIPPNDHRPCFFTRACPPSWVLSPKISKIVPHFFSILTTFQLRTASESSILCLKHQNLL